MFGEISMDHGTRLPMYTAGLNKLGYAMVRRDCPREMSWMIYHIGMEADAILGSY